MKSSYLHIPRWVAALVVVVALIGGGILAVGLRDWTGQEVFGASESGLRLAHGARARWLWGAFMNGFSVGAEAGVARGGEHSHVEDRQVEGRR